MHFLGCDLLLPSGGLGPAGVSTLALFVFGLTVGLTHCTAMCSPFVISRVMRAAAAMPATATATGWRLWVAALPAYHAGRTLTYTAIGAAFGTLGNAFASFVATPIVQAGFVGVALIMVLAQSFSLRQAQALTQWWNIPQRLVARYATGTGKGSELVAGMMLGLLPCGMVYAAAASAAATANPLSGALAMAAFAAGTWLPLIGVGALGLACARRWRLQLGRIGPVFLALNLAGLGLWLVRGI